MKDQEFKGYWWIPSAPQSRVAGKLTFSEEKGPKLNLSGSFHNPHDDLVRLEPVILGTSSNGRSVTLENSILTRTSSRGSVATNSKYYSHGVFIGMHSESRERLRFGKMRLEFSYLNDWIDITGMQYDRTRKSDDPLQITYIDPDPIEARVEGAKITIIFEHRTRSNRHSSSVEEHRAILVEVDENRSPDELINDYEIPLQNFLNLGTGLSNFIDDIKFIPNTGRTSPVTLLYSQSSYRPRKKDYVHWEQMVFGFRLIRDNFQAVLTKWMRACRELGPVMSLFGQERSASGLFVHLRLLSIAQALELFHRKRYLSEKIPDHLPKDLREALILSTPSEYRQLVNEALQYGNQKNLRARLDELLADRESLMRRLIPDRIEKFTAAATNSRNYYTHFSEKTKDKALHRESLFWLTECLSILLQSCLLSEIGITIEDQCNWFDVSDRFYLLRQNRQRLVDALRTLD